MRAFLAQKIRLSLVSVFIFSVLSFNRSSIYNFDSQHLIAAWGTSTLLFEHNKKWIQQQKKTNQLQQQQ